MQGERSRGFTLVELLIVVALIAILTAVTVPIVSNQKAKANDTAVATQVASVAKHIETLLTDGSGPIDGNSDTSAVRLVETGESEHVPTTTGVQWNARGTASAYCITGWSTRPSKYTVTKPLLHDSTSGGTAAPSGTCSSEPAAALGRIIAPLPSLTNLCVLPTRAGGGPTNIETMAQHDGMRPYGWTNYVDKRDATSTQDLLGCDAAIVFGEVWAPNPAALTLARAWYDTGGKVLSTSNDVYSAHLPHLITTSPEATILSPSGGSVPADLTDRQRLNPAYPAWTPGFATDIDPTQHSIKAVANGAVCVATASTDPTTCMVVARSEPNGARWVHIQTRIGGVSDKPGEAVGGDAALRWLTAP